MWKKIIIGGSIFVGIVGFIFILVQFSFQEVWKVFKGASIFDIILFLLVSFFLLIALTWKLKVVMDSQNMRIPFWSLFQYRLAGYGISYVTPGPRVGGEPVMAQLIKKYFNIDFMKTLSAMIIDKTIEISTLGILFVFGGTLLLLNYALPENTKYAVIVVAIGFGALVAYFYYRMLKGNHFFLKILELTGLTKVKWIAKYEKRILLFEKRIIHFYVKEKKAFYQNVMLTILIWALMYLEYKFALSILGLNAGILSIFLIFSFLGATLLLPIPMALGAQEAGQISAFAIIGAEPHTGVALSLLIRARDILTVSAGFILLSYHGLDAKKMMKRLFGKIVKPDKGVVLVPKNE